MAPAAKQLENVGTSKGFDLSKPILIHVCKDRTLSYRNRFQPIFNGVALPVFSVESVDMARTLIRSVSSAQYEEHPLIPGDTWFKITLDGPEGFIQYLEYEDIQKVADKLSSVYYRLKMIRER